MKHLLPLVLAALVGTTAFGQRYTTEIFTDVNVDVDVVYGENYSVLTGSPTLENLKMDVYTPVGDTASSRYTIILAHAGSFLPKNANTLPFGNKSDSSIVEMCTQFAKRGWTAVAMNYRLGWNPTPDILGGDQETRASTIIQAVYRSMQDMKTCIRYMRKTEAEGNAYGIDPTRIVIGGSNSGGYTALAAGALNKESELNLAKFLATSGSKFVDVNVLGDFQGAGGDPSLNVTNHVGYASEAQMVLNLGGAMGDSSWIEAGEVPVVNFHGVADALTPYKTATVIVAATGDPIVEVSGSYVISREVNALGNNDVMMQSWTDAYSARAEALTSFEGHFAFTGGLNGFEPWSWYDPTDPYIVDSVDIGGGTMVPASGFGSAANPFASKPKALAYIDTIMNYFCPRAVLALADPAPMGEALSINDIAQRQIGVDLYPNPAQGPMTIVSKSSDEIQGYQLIDITGKTVAQNAAVSDIGFNLDASDFAPGIYFLVVDFKDSSVTERVVFK